jgi:hypothetical protein
VTVRFLADEDLDTDIIQGLRAREPAIDILDVKTTGSRGTNTMTRHSRDRLAAGTPTPGVFILTQQESAIGEIIESPLLVWAASQAEEWPHQIAYLPFR